MGNPLTFMTRFVRAALPDPALARCPVCHEDVHPDAPALELRGMRVHRGCASYRMRRRARLR